MDWTRNLSVLTAKKITVDWPWNPWKIHGFCKSVRTPQGLPGGVISPHLPEHCASFCVPCRCITLVEVLYAAFPALLYIDTELTFLLLRPLLEFQLLPALHPNEYAAPDLGVWLYHLAMLSLKTFLLIRCQLATCSREHYGPSHLFHRKYVCLPQFSACPIDWIWILQTAALCLSWLWHIHKSQVVVGLSITTTGSSGSGQITW